MDESITLSFMFALQPYREKCSHIYIR